jgi:type I restriction enzyme M protein
MRRPPRPTPESKWFDNADFGYWKITVERPLRLKSQLKRSSIETLRFASGDEALRSEIYAKHGDKLYDEFAKLKPEIEAWLKGDEATRTPMTRRTTTMPSPPRKPCPKSAARSCSTPPRGCATRPSWNWPPGAAGTGRRRVRRPQRVPRPLRRCDEAHGKKLGAPEKKAIYKAVSWRDEAAPPVIAKRSKLKAGEHFEPGYDGAYLETVGKDRFMVEYEPDTDLRDTEQVPLKEQGGIEAFFAREVLPHAPDAWIAMDATKIGYEISFARYFYKPTPLRTLDEIRADILKLEQQTEGLLHKIVGARNGDG